MTGFRRDKKSLNTKKPIDCYSKYVNKIYYNGGNDEDGLIRLLMTKCVKKGQKPIIITVGDFATKAVDNHQGELRDYFMFSHIHHEQGAIAEWMNKEKQKALANRVGLNTTKSCHIEVENGKYSIPLGVNYPCFTKTREYLPGCKLTLKKCANESELIEFVNSLAKKFNLTLLVEDFKTIETEYAVVGFSDGKSVVIPGIIKILSMAHGSHFGVACKGEIMPIKGYEELIEKFNKMLLDIGFVGLFDIDFYYSERKFYFGELNFRMGGSGYAYTKSGVNLPCMFVKSLINETIDDMPQLIQKSSTFVNERMWVGDWMGGFVSTCEFMKCLRESEFCFVNDEFDKTPQRQLYRSLIVLYIKKMIKRVVAK